MVKSNSTLEDCRFLWKDTGPRHLCLLSLYFVCFANQSIVDTEALARLKLMSMASVEE